MKRFCDYHLRTSNVEAARAFYRAVLGYDLANVCQLHEQAVAQGARPHWLGYIDVGEVDPAAAAFVARGAAPLGPKCVSPRGLEAAVMRDPGGAVVALAKPSPVPAQADAGSSPDVVWHLLNTNDVERAKANYGELFGWEFKAPLDLGSHGVFHPFSWQPGGAVVGAFADIIERPGVHPHWLFHFRVAALEAALAAVRAGGGKIIGPITMPSGEHIAICDDGQGAAFTLSSRNP